MLWEGSVDRHLEAEHPLTQALIDINKCSEEDTAKCKSVSWIIKSELTSCYLQQDRHAEAYGLV